MNNNEIITLFLGNNLSLTTLLLGNILYFTAFLLGNVWLRPKTQLGLAASGLAFRDELDELLRFSGLVWLSLRGSHTNLLVY